MGDWREGCVVAMLSVICIVLLLGWQLCFWCREDNCDQKRARGRDNTGYRSVPNYEKNGNDAGLGDDVSEERGGGGREDGLNWFLGENLRVTEVRY
jgi:hypothetical protein